MNQLSIKAWRTEKGFTQEDTAKALGITRQAYRMKESGRTEFTFAEVIVLAKMFDCSLDTIRHP